MHKAAINGHQIQQNAYGLYSNVPSNFLKFVCAQNIWCAPVY